MAKDNYGDAFIRDFLKVFDSYSMSNKPYGRMILHILLGQALKHVYFREDARKIDIRIHGLLIRPSGSGKGAGYGFFCRMAEDLGLDNHILTEATDAGLVGTGSVDNDGNVIINEGIMKDADIVSMEEASPMFDYESSFSKKNLTYLQIAMNPLWDASCMISKKIGSLPTAIKFKPHASFLLMTYIPDKFLDALVKRGVIQRFVTIIQDVGLDERMKTVNKAIDRLNMTQEKRHDKNYSDVILRFKTIILSLQKKGNYEEYKMKTKWNDKYIRKAFKDKISPKLRKDKIDLLMDNLIKQLESFEDEKWYLKHGYCFNISDKSKEGIREVEHELVEMIKDTTETAQEKLSEFTHRLFEILVRLAIHHAILRLDNTVKTEDVIYAKRAYKPIWQETIYFIEDNLVPTTNERLKMNKIIQGAVEEYHILLKENKPKHVKNEIWVRKGTLVKRLQKKWDNCSYVTAVKRFSKIKTLDSRDTNKNKWFLEKKYGNIPYVTLIQDVA